jgi:hypothetical protein
MNGFISIDQDECQQMIEKFQINDIKDLIKNYHRYSTILRICNDCNKNKHVDKKYIIDALCYYNSNDLSTFPDDLETRYESYAQIRSLHFIKGDLEKDKIMDLIISNLK